MCVSDRSHQSGLFLTSHYGFLFSDFALVPVLGRGPPVPVRVLGGGCCLVRRVDAVPPVHARPPVGGPATELQILDRSQTL